MWPALGVLVYTLMVVTTRTERAGGEHGASVGLSIALGVILATQIGALAVARSRS